MINIIFTNLSRYVWEKLDLGRGYRPHCVWSVLTTLVKILPYRPPARLIRANYFIVLKSILIVCLSVSHILNSNKLCVCLENENTYDNNLFILEHFTLSSKKIIFSSNILDLLLVELSVDNCHANLTMCKISLISLYVFIQNFHQKNNSFLN